jgi:hypothetical protein
MQDDTADLMVTCDTARWTWFARAMQHRRFIAPPDDESLEGVIEIRDRVREDEGGGIRAIMVSHTIEQYYLWPAFTGVYLSETGQPVGLHAWNVLPDGSILDCCLDAFGEGDGVRISRPGSGNWRRYRREWSADYNPSLSDRYPELEGIAWNGLSDLESIRLSAQHDRTAQPVACR